MRLGLLLICLGLGTASACGRPSLERPLGEDGGVVRDEDASEPEPEPTDDGDDGDDADDDAPTGDAGLPPTTVPDATAMTPPDAGPPLVTEPDAGEPVELPEDCLMAETVGSTIRFSPDVTLSDVEINGQSASQPATVAAGDRIRVTFNLTFSNCGAAFTVAAMYLGVEAAAGPACKYSPPCSEYNPITLPLPVEFEIPVPTEPGLHYVLGAIGATASCREEQELETRVAALCVRNPG